jgi:valyl-tRNA synthetase
MRYPLADGSGEVEIATTRPETYLADTAVAVNPEDDRYKDLIGKKVRLPFIDREIPIIGDSYVDMEFGTGCLKVTPGADPNDFQIGRRHGLPEIASMDESGIITIGEFSGMDRFEAREAIIGRFKEVGLMGEIKPLTHSVGHCYRCNTVIEPMISLQWFVKVAPLAEEAVKAVKDGRTRIIPKMWEASYFEWMENIRDWCISRQIWWGHRIPAWHCHNCGHINVSETDVEKCEKCASTDIEQETDVLDTWFSSALWPFSTQGWPEQTKTLDKFYPTGVLVTAFDILFFWVARMMMMGLKFMGEVPFKDVYIHALVRDSEGQKMSKTKGNVIDPLVMTEKYGADAMRFALTAFAAQGRDIRMSEERIEGYRNFVNKIWNASRFIFMNLEESGAVGGNRGERDEDKWIITKLSSTVSAVEKALAGYNFNEAAAALYQFFWNQFCDWYVELIKDRIFKDDAKASALATASYVLEKALICLHPFMPFVTEHIWQKLTGGESIMKANFPEATEIYAEAEGRIDAVLELIGLIRNIRGEYKVNPGQMVDAYVITNEVSIGTLFTDKKPLVEKMARANLKFAEKQPDKSASQVSKNYTVCLPLEGLIDKEQELARLNKELATLEKDHKLYSGKLANERYLEKAAPDVVAKDRAKVADLEKQIVLVKESIKAIG